MSERVESQTKWDVAKVAGQKFIHVLGRSFRRWSRRFDAGSGRFDAGQVVSTPGGGCSFSADSASSFFRPLMGMASGPANAS